MGFIAGIVFLALVILSNVFAAQQKGELMERSEAIVLAPSVTVRSTPSESGTSLFILHEGRKVEINVSDVNGDTDIAVIINSTKADSNGGISKPIVITD